MHYIFGYGSMISAKGINGRGMKKQYKDKDLFESQLCYFKREWNATWQNMLFLGLTTDKTAFVNGVLFKVDDSDIDILCRSFPSEQFQFEDVTSHVRTKLVLNKDDTIFTFVVKTPSQDAKIPLHYVALVKDGLEIRGKDFTDEFIRTTHNFKDIWVT